MEERATYTSECLQGIRSECLTALPKWVAPTGEEIKLALSMAGWSGEGFSRLIGVDGRTVRRWTSNEKSIPFSAWAIVCLQAGYGRIWES